MASPSSFVAVPGKRIAAFVFDFFAIFLCFMVVAVTAESVGRDVSNFATFAACAFIYHGLFLALREGRTLGKATQDICVVGADGQPIKKWQALARSSVRYVPIALLAINTRDWVLSEAMVGLAIKLVAALLWLAEYSFLTSSPTRQTLADRLARTLVVNLPTWQPHRAPAVPMFSATDAEFGQPPKRPPSHRRTVASEA